MMKFFSNLGDWIDAAIAFLGIYGPLFGCFLICIESMFPVLPLSVFITLNFLAFGHVIGFLISWVCTIFGCCLSFFLFRKKIRNWFERKYRVHPNVDHVMKIIDKVNFRQFVVIIAIPFTPAFLINIAAGLSEMPFKKYFTAIAIGKIFMIYFWGYVGTTLLQSLRNPIAFLKVAIIVAIAYFISVIVGKKFHLDEV